MYSGTVVLRYSGLRVVSLGNGWKIQKVTQGNIFKTVIIMAGLWRR